MISLIGGTDKGLVRKTNQDGYEFAVLSERLAFAVLCDGMGGENGGGIASETVIRFVTEVLLRDLHDDMTELSLRSVMQSAVAGANALVYDAAQKDPLLSGMGTTLIMAVFLGEHLFVGYVGDSRVYLVTPEQERKLTKDHTVVQMLVDIGEITEEDAASHPKRHYITRAIGVAPGVEADFLEHPLTADCTVLLCSDGMYNYLAAGTLRELLESCVQSGSVNTLIELAKAGGGTDNITAVVAAVKA